MDKLHNYSDSESECNNYEIDLRTMKTMATQYGKILDKLISLNQIEQAEKLFYSLKNPSTVMYTILLKAYV